MTPDKVQVGDSTVGTSTSTTYYTNPSYSTEKGWECPRCKRINAPWVRQCDCNGNNWTITSDWTYKPEWWKEVTCSPDTFRIHPESDPIWKTTSSICGTDSTTATKSDTNSTIYTTATNSTVGGSDYWDNMSQRWTNEPQNSNKVNDMINRIDHITTTTYYNTGDTK